MVTYPGDWVEMPLAKFAEINPHTDIPETFMYVDLESVKGISLIGSRKETRYSAPSRAKRYAQKGDVFYQTVRPYQRNNYLFNLDGDYVFSTGYAQMRTSNSSEFLFLLLRSDRFVSIVLDNCTGTSYPAINPNRLGEINIYVPVDIKEQEAIAEAITAFDTRIENLSALIEKKRAVRDGALEDLMSGRTRLEGYSGEWTKIPFSQFTEINPYTEIPEAFTYVDLEAVKGITLISPRKETRNTAPSRAKRYARKGDVFYQTVRPYQKNNYLFYLEGDYVFSTGYAQLRTRNSPHFLFLLIRNDTFVNKVLDNCTGTSYPAINPKRLGEIMVYVPTDVKEQEAIASVLTAMDEEITALEAERDKYAQIREGVMDDLLTGRVRLNV